MLPSKHKKYPISSIKKNQQQKNGQLQELAIFIGNIVF